MSLESHSLEQLICSGYFSRATAPIIFKGDSTFTSFLIPLARSPLDIKYHNVLWLNNLWQWTLYLYYLSK